MRKIVFLVVLLSFVFGFSQCDSHPRQSFMITIENNAQNMYDYPVVFAPGVWALHTGEEVFFDIGEPDRGDGLEALAEDGNPTMLNMKLEYQDNVMYHDVFNTPVGSEEAGPIAPGSAYQFMVMAAPGERLSFASMFAQSNDLFIGPGEKGIMLFDDAGMPQTGVYRDIYLWDAGTEVNEEPGIGPNQAPRQMAPNTGFDENGVVELVNDGFMYPKTMDMVKVTVMLGD